MRQALADFLRRVADKIAKPQPTPNGGGGPPPDGPK